MGERISKLESEAALLDSSGEVCRDLVNANSASTYMLYFNISCIDLYFLFLRLNLPNIIL